MSAFGFLLRGRIQRQDLWRYLRGFSLLEVVLVLFILGILAATLTPSVAGVVEKTRLQAEKRTLAELADTITASFQATDLTNLNVAATAATIGPADLATEFSVSTSAGYGTTDANAWFAKVARARGLNPQVGVPPSQTAQPALAQLVTNPLGNPRLLFIRPDEPGQLRFLLLSLLARPDQLALPPYEGTQPWFDAIWANDWESRTALPPSYWQSRLSPDQFAAWMSGTGGTTATYRLCVQRIVLPKYRLTVNNNHPTSAAFLSFNNIANAFQVPAGSGASTTPEILGGRLVTVNQGTAWPGVEALRLFLRSNDTVIVQ